MTASSISISSSQWSPLHTLLVCMHQGLLRDLSASIFCHLSAEVFRAPSCQQWTHIKATVCPRPYVPLTPCVDLTKNLFIMLFRINLAFLTHCWLYSEFSLPLEAFSLSLSLRHTLFLHAAAPEVSPHQCLESYENESGSRSVVSESLQPHGEQPTWLLCAWDFPGKKTRVGCHSLLQGIFPTQGSNLGLLHCRQILY